MNRESASGKIKFKLESEGIMYIECLPGTTLTLEDARESTRIGGELTENIPRPLLCDLTNVVKMSQECRQHFAGAEHAKVFTKCVLIITSPMSRIIGNFFLGANRPLRPTRLFTSREEGLDWLRNAG
mgnify:CR=1 FL=1